MSVPISLALMGVSNGIILPLNSSGQLLFDEECPQMGQLPGTSNTQDYKLK